MKTLTMKHWIKKILSAGGIAVYFIITLEIMIMISPFAFLFYSVFNPFFHFLARFSATRWLTGFYLPHMIFPPTLFLQGVRILGSVLFVFGFVIFLICALQIYLGKILKNGVASLGLYRLIRHPQYVGLSICGIGMAILWPRFLVLVTLALMIVLYYFLARDEERRMTIKYGDAYRRYLEQTGMVFPLWVERSIVSIAARYNLKPSMPVIFPVTTLAVVLVAGFTLRALTIAELPVSIKGNVAVVSMLPEDNKFLNETASILSANQEIASGSLVLDRNKAYVGYLMPVDYVMQGMIANTGERWQLYKRHHTLQMISDWVFHPFRHLRQPPIHLDHQMPAGHTMAMARRHHCPLGINNPNLDCGNCPYRRVVLVQEERQEGKILSNRYLFALNTGRTAVGYLDLDVLSGRIIDAVRINGKTAWEDVPTPIF
jgi:protein-S-isoprenylcysteine O-methyltransferase Ste14